MVIQFNRTKIHSGALGNEARQVLSKKLIDSMGGYSSCDPHGTPMYAQSYSTTPVHETAPSAWAEPQPEQSWSAQPDNTGFKPQPESSWAAPQPDTSSEQSSWDAVEHNMSSTEPQSDSSWAAPQHDTDSEQIVQATAPVRNAEPKPAAVTSSPWCGPSSSAKVEPQTVVESQPEPLKSNEEPAAGCAVRVNQVEPQISQCDETKANREQKSQRREWYECLATREFETAMALRCSEEAPLDEMIVPQMQVESKSMLNQLADELVFCAQPACNEESVEHSANPFITDIPMAGIARTERGTIEYIAHPTGTFIQPTYNNCGILMRISFNDGSRFERSNGPIPWIIYDAAGNEVKEIPISSVSIDSNGNVSFVTLDGRTTTMHANGTVSQKAA